MVEGVGVGCVMRMVMECGLTGAFRRARRDWTVLVKMLWACAESEGDGVCASASSDGVDMTYSITFWSEEK
jgi:hypothetical protein